MDTVNNFITNLETVARNDTVAIYIPSINRDVMFKKLNAKQHKEIITTVIDNAASGITLAIVLGDIIKENALEKINFLVTDKTYIATALRAASLGPTLIVNEQTINLSELLKNKLPLDSTLTKQVIKEDLFTINISIPTLDKETYINRESKKKIADFAEKTLAKDTLGEVYTKALVKFIDSMSLNNQGEEGTANFDDMSAHQRAIVVDKLPLTATTKIIEYANKVKNEETKFATLQGQLIQLSVDQAFFTV